MKKEKVVAEKDKKRADELLKKLVDYAGLFGFTETTLKGSMEVLKKGIKIMFTEKIMALRKYAEEKEVLPPSGTKKIASSHSLKYIGIAGLLTSSLLAAG